MAESGSDGEGDDEDEDNEGPAAREGGEGAEGNNSGADEERYGFSH